MEKTQKLKYESRNCGIPVGVYGAFRQMLVSPVQIAWRVVKIDLIVANPPDSGHSFDNFFVFYA